MADGEYYTSLLCIVYIHYITNFIGEKDTSIIPHKIQFKSPSIQD